MSSITIGTHSGTFHCDEVLACYMLKLLPENKNAKIVRTRDLSILETCDIVVDVGRKYDPSRHRYDHHMSDFKESISTVINKPGYDTTIKLSSAGLVYCYFGHRVIKVLHPHLNEAEVEVIFKKVYESFIKEIDGLDNGVPMFSDEPRYYIVTDLTSKVSRLNRQWNSINVDQEEQFKKAMILVGQDFTDFIQHAVCSWLPARLIVEEAIKNRFQIDSSGEIIYFDKGVPWKEHLFAIEKEWNINPTIKFSLFRDDSYRVQGVPQQLYSFICRIFLPQQWAGLTGDELSSVSGIKDCVFVHSGRFIGGNKTMEGALAMARQALINNKAS